MVALGALLVSIMVRRSAKAKVMPTAKKADVTLNGTGKTPSAKDLVLQVLAADGTGKPPSAKDLVLLAAKPPSAKDLVLGVAWDVVEELKPGALNFGSSRSVNRQDSGGSYSAV